MKLLGEVPSLSEFGRIRSWLAKNGVSQQQIDMVLGDNQLTRKEIVDRLKLMCRDLPLRQ